MLRYKYSSSNVNSKGEIGPRGIEERDVNSKGRKYKGEASIKSKSTKKSSVENGFRVNSMTPCNIDQMVLSVKSGAVTKNGSRGPAEIEPVKEAGATTRRDHPFQGSWKAYPWYLSHFLALLPFSIKRGIF